MSVRLGVPGKAAGARPPTCQSLESRGRGGWAVSRQVPVSHPQARLDAPLALPRPRARAQGAWEPRPPCGPSSGKVSTTFSPSGGESRRPAVAPPPVSSDRSPPSPRRTRGFCAAARSPASPARPSVRAGPVRLPVPARRCDPPPPPAHPERHHELALQEEKQRQIQPHRADSEVSRRRTPRPGRRRETSALRGVLGGKHSPERGGSDLAGRATERPRKRGPGGGELSRECAPGGNAAPRDTLELASAARVGMGVGAGGDRGET